MTLEQAIVVSAFLAVVLFAFFFLLAMVRRLEAQQKYRQEEYNQLRQRYWKVAHDIRLILKDIRLILNHFELEIVEVKREIKEK